MATKANTRAMRIHGKWYDVETFDHPGGPVMLELGKGRDATGLFESHHPFTSRRRLELLLSKYETSKPCELIDEKDTGEEFIWPEVEQKNASSTKEVAPVSEFASELRSRVRNYFEAEAKRRGVSVIQATKATPWRWTEMAILSALFIATLPAVFRGELWAVFAMPAVYWILGVNTFHDASHFGISRDWKVNALWTYIGWYFSSPLEWYHQHVIGHHVYANIPNKDPDLYHNATMERHTNSLRWRPLHQHQHKTWVPIWMIGTYAMNFLKPFQMFFSGHYNRSVKMIEMPFSRIAIHFAGRALVFFMCHVLPFLLFPLWKAAIFAVVPVTLVSCSFMLSSQVNHLTHENVDQYDSDFYKHQVITGHTFGHESYLTFLFTGGLNYQIEHHLFPCVNHCHHYYLHPIVKEVCAKHNVPFHYTPSLWQAFNKYLSHMQELGVKPASD